MELSASFFSFSSVALVPPILLLLRDEKVSADVVDRLDGVLELVAVLSSLEER